MFIFSISLNTISLELSLFCFSRFFFFFFFINGHHQSVYNVSLGKIKFYLGLSIFFILLFDLRVWICVPVITLCTDMWRAWQERYRRVPMQFQMLKQPFGRSFIIIFFFFFEWGLKLEICLDCVFVELGFWEFDKNWWRFVHTWMGMLLLESISWSLNDLRVPMFMMVNWFWSWIWIPPRIIGVLCFLK